MDRRTFMGALAAGTFATVPRVASAQPAGTTRRIGVLTARAIPRTPPAFIDALRERGWVEGRNLIIERRGGDGVSERVPGLTAELAQMKLDVIVSFGAVAGVAVKNATTTIPIVATAGDPANTYWQRVREDYEQAFRAMWMQPLFVEVANPGEIPKVIAQIAGQHADALMVRGDPVFGSNREQIGRLAVQHALPTMAEDRPIAEAGILMSYGPNSAAVACLVADCIDRILRGARPGDLPIAQPAVFELVINGKTAKALGLTVPQSLLLRGEVI